MTGLPKICFLLAYPRKLEPLAFHIRNQPAADRLVTTLTRHAETLCTRSGIPSRSFFSIPETWREHQKRMAANLEPAVLDTWGNFLILEGQRDSWIEENIIRLKSLFSFSQMVWVSGAEDEGEDVFRSASEKFGLRFSTWDL